jgi:rhodanese-related sulfurtransferase
MTVQELVAEAKRQIREVGVATVQKRLPDGKHVVLDVREPDEFAAGHLPGAINVPRGVLEFKLAGTPDLADPAKPVFVYCRTGGRSALAALNLQRLGYSNVESMAGGYEAWTAAGTTTGTCG